MRLLEMPWLREPEADWSVKLKKVTDGHSTENGEATTGELMQQLASFHLDYVQSLKFGRSLRKLQANSAELSPLRAFHLSVVSSWTMDIAVDALAAGAARHGVNLRVSNQPFGQVMQPILDPASAFYQQGPDAVLIALDQHWFGWTGSFVPDSGSVADALAQYETMIRLVREHSSMAMILQTIPVPVNSLLGSQDIHTAEALGHCIQELNRGLARFASEQGCKIFDLAQLVAQIGADNWFSPAQWFNYKIPFQADATPVMAEWFGRLLGALRGTTAKCLVLDLDNTLWGGAIGDDGLDGIVLGPGSGRGEAHVALQKAAMDLRQRGIFLAVASRNTEAVALEAFAKHPEMLLREQDISVFCCHWGEKAESLKLIAKQLNIGIEALVFLDDNPVEREAIRQQLPAVKVPEIPADPAYYAWLLNASGYFEALTLTAEDRGRTDMQKADVARERSRHSSKNLEDYLRSLDMRLSARPFDQQNRTRVAQLINKTNQFNVTTIRRTEAEIADFEKRQGGTALSFRLSDRHGDLGIIAAIMCNQVAHDIWHIDTWVMSCRVFGRQIEQACLTILKQTALRTGVRLLRGSYVPTAKNHVVAALFSNLGFVKESGDDSGATSWLLDMKTHQSSAVPMELLIESEVVDD